MAPSDWQDAARTGDKLPAGTLCRLTTVYVAANKSTDAFIILNSTPTVTTYLDGDYAIYIANNNAGGKRINYGSKGSLSFDGSPVVTDGMRFGFVYVQVGSDIQIRIGYTTNPTETNSANYTLFGPVIATNPGDRYVVLDPNVVGRGDYTSVFGAVATT